RGNGGGWLRAAPGNEMRRRERGVEHAGDPERDGAHLRLREIRQHDHADAGLGIARDDRLEALPTSAVRDAQMSALVEDPPTKPVGIRGAVVEPHRRPRRIERRGTRHAAMIQRDGPASPVTNREAERAVRCRIEGRGDPFLILQLPFSRRYPAARLGTMSASEITRESRILSGWKTESRSGSP